MKVDHIGYAVKNIERSIREFSKLGYIFEDVITDEKRNIYICFGKLGDYRVELVSPIKNDKSTPVDSYIKKYGNIPYHLCYSSDNLDKDIEELNSKGFKTIIPPDTAYAFGGKRVVFMMNIAVGVMEIVEA